MAGVQTLKICLLTAVLSTGLRLSAGNNDSFVPENYANVTTNCGTEAMTVYVEVNKNFSGEIYADGFFDEDSCVSFHDYDSTSYSVYGVTYDYEETECGQAWEEKDNNTHEFSAVTYIQFDGNLIQDGDKRHKSVCTFDNEQQVSSRTGNVKDAGGQESNDTVSGTLLAFIIVDADNNTLGNDDVVAVGDRLELRIGLKTIPRFTDMIVSECQAFGKDPGLFPRADNVKLIESDGCPVDSTVLAGAPSYDEEAEGEILYRVPIYAFIFFSSYREDRNYLYFTCNVFLCSANAPCARPACQSRERRAADDTRASISDTDHTAQLVRLRRAEGTHSSTVGGSVQVRAATDGGRQSQGASQSVQGESYAQCVKSPTGQSLLAVLVILVLALITTIVALTILNCRLRRRLRKLERGEEGRGAGVMKLYDHKHGPF